MKISIVTVCYNSANTILKTIESVNKQTYKNIEHIFIDGHSTDNTLEIIRSNSKREIIILSEKDNGIYDAMNKGIKVAKGDIIGFLNSDDIFFDESSVQKIAESFDDNIDCIYSNLQYINNSGKVVRDWVSKPFKKGMFQNSWTPAHPTFYCKRSIYMKYPIYRCDYIIASDVDLMFRYLEVYGLRSYYKDAYTVRMLTGGLSNNSILSSFIITREVRRTFIENKYTFNFLYYLTGKLFKAVVQKTKALITKR